MAENKKATFRVKTASESVKGKIKAINEKEGRSGAKSAPRGNRTKLLISVVNQKDDVVLKEILDDFSVTLSFTFAGRGTARSAVLDYLGIGETEKAVVFSLFPESDEELILHEIREKMSLYLVGRGISFTVPLSAVSDIIAGGLVRAAANKTVNGSKIMNNEGRKYDLIIAAVDSNLTDEAMEAARSAGAAGGTIIRARSLENAKAEQFIGITLAKEQELLLILSKREGKLAIMNALSERVGLKTEAGGIIFSIPVDRTAGIGAAEEIAAEEFIVKKGKKSFKKILT